MNKVDLVERSRLRRDIPPFRPGDRVKVHVKVREGQRERLQVFEGDVISRRGGGLRESFTVRKVSFGVGVERTFPIHAPVIAKLEIVRHGSVRRAKLYYLRKLSGRKAKIGERRTRIQEWTLEDGTSAEVTAEEMAEIAQAEAATAEAATADAATETPEAEAPEAPAAEAAEEPAAEAAEAPAAEVAEAEEAADAPAEDTKSE